MPVRKFLSHLGNWSIGSGPLHARLSRGIQSAIQRGLIMPGSRLPAERELAKALAVSRTTVVTAYTALQQAAWVESRRGSGTFACMRSLGANAILRDGIDASSSAFDLLQNESSDVIDMTIGCAFPLTDHRRKTRIPYSNISESHWLSDARSGTKSHCKDCD